MAPVAGAAALVPVPPRFQHTWQDSASEVTITWHLGKDEVSKADVSCQVQRKHLQVSILGFTVCDGELSNAVDPAESYWSLERAPGEASGRGGYRALSVSLAKCVAERPWADLWAGEGASRAADGCGGDKCISDFAGSFVIGSQYDPGDKDAQEDVADQLEGERLLEPQYLDLVRRRGVDDDETLQVFFRLFNEKIQLYRLNDLEKYLKDVLPICRKRGGDFRIKAIQALAIVRFKQGRLREALDLLLEMERYYGRSSAALSENIAHAHTNLGELTEAEQRFRESIRFQEAEGEPARGSTLLGLGIVYQGLGRLKEARVMAENAHDWYACKACGRPSSLQAKCAVALAGIQQRLGEFSRAEELLREAVSAYELTCGVDSPLVGTALSHLGSLLLLQRKAEEARAVLLRAYKLEVATDAWNFEHVVQLHCYLMLSHTVNDDTVDRSEFRRYLDLVDRFTARARADKAVCDQVGIACKLAGEVKACAAEYSGAASLLEEALEHFRPAAALGDCVAVASVKNAEQLLGLCCECLRGEKAPPMRLRTDDPEYGQLLPPGGATVRRSLAGLAQQVGPCTGEPADVGAGSSSSSGPWIEELPSLDTCGGAGGSGGAGPSGGVGAGRGGSHAGHSMVRGERLPLAELATAEELLEAGCAAARRYLQGQGGTQATASTPVGTLEAPPGAPTLHCRELLVSDFPTLQRLWSLSSAERVLPTEQLLSRHLSANPGLSFVAWLGQEVLGAAIAGAAGPFGVIRQVLSCTRHVVHPGDDVLPGIQEVRSTLVDCIASALRRAGCTSVEVLVPPGEPQEFWESRATGPVRSAFAL